MTCNSKSKNNFYLCLQERSDKCIHISQKMWIYMVEMSSSQASKSEMDISTNSPVTSYLGNTVIYMIIFYISALFPYNASDENYFLHFAMQNIYAHFLAHLDEVEGGLCYRPVVGVGVRTIG